MSRSDASRKCGGCRKHTKLKRCDANVAISPAVLPYLATPCHHPRIRSTDLTPLELPHAQSGALVASLTINTKIALSPKVIHNGTIKQNLPVFCFPTWKPDFFGVKTQPWSPSALASRWRFHCAHISSIKPIAQFASHAGQELGTYNRILDTTQGKHILWVDLDARVWSGRCGKIFPLRFIMENIEGTRNPGDVEATEAIR